MSLHGCIHMLIPYTCMGGIHMQCVRYELCTHASSYRIHMHVCTHASYPYVQHCVILPMQAHFEHMTVNWTTAHASSYRTHYMCIPPMQAHTVHTACVYYPCKLIPCMCILPMQAHTVNTACVYHPCKLIPYTLHVYTTHASSYRTHCMCILPM